MKLLRAASLSVVDPAASARRYVQWFDYRIVEEGCIDAELASSWGTPLSAGRAFVTVAPASGANVLIRFVACDAIAGYRALRTYGWAALEICVQDVLSVNERMAHSPFKIVGPPREIDGLPAIYPMQVQGPDQEIIYLTQIRSDLPAFDLPRAACPIDKLFILVLACSNLKRSIDWFERCVQIKLGREMDIVYTMLANSFGLPATDTHTIATMTHERDVFLELDQYPTMATPRSAKPGHLPPGIAIATLLHPQFSQLNGPWITEPARRAGAMYADRMTGTLLAPDGSLVEIVASS